MGDFIRTLRREGNMTQKDLAERLNLTDRAISKWERGVCAPDIGLLEPLAEVLGTTVPELIRGERDEHSRESELQTQTVIDFSKRQIAHQVGAARRRYLLAAAAALLIVVLVAAVLTGKADRDAEIKLNGGVLHVEWSPEDNHVYKEGPAEFVFDGVWPDD